MDQVKIKPLTDHHTIDRLDQDDLDALTSKFQPSPTPSPPQPRSHNRWRCTVRICGCCSAAVAALGLIMLVLSFTVLKVKNPVLTLNSIYIGHLNINLYSTPIQPIAINSTLTADISIKNPNVASLRLESSTTRFYYMGQTVGVGYAPRADVPARRTARMNVTVDVLGDRLVLQTNATGSIVMHGYVNLTSFTEVKGRVSVGGVYKRDIDVVMNCSMSLEVPLAPDHQVRDEDCQAYVV